MLYNLVILDLYLCICCMTLKVVYQPGYNMARQRPLESLTATWLSVLPPSPRHPKDRHPEEAIRIIRQPRKTNIPCLKRSQQGE